MVSQMHFDSKLAHESLVKRLNGFSSTRQLYDKIAEAFSIQAKDVLYCTLNTHNHRDMNAILGNYLSSGDLIVAHICGQTKQVKLTKRHQHLGLTITDNGNGRAFVKRVDSDDHAIGCLIQPGDHISSINGIATVGMRHHEVAKSLRDLAIDSSFVVGITEPLSVGSDHQQVQSIFNSLIERNANSSLKFRINHDKTASDDDHQLNSLGYTTDTSLPINKLLSKKIISQENWPSSDDPATRTIISKMNSVLESFLGINDDNLALQVHRLAKESLGSYEKFISAIETSDLNEFNFSPEIQIELWNCVINCDGK